MSQNHEVEGLPIDLSFGEGIDPTDWRNMPDPDGDDDEAVENDEYVPTPKYVIDTLGFDPDEFDVGGEQD